MYEIVKYSSFSKLKPTFFPEGGNSISYVIIVISLNVVYVKSSSRVIKLRRSSVLVQEYILAADDCSLFSNELKNIVLFIHY